MADFAGELLRGLLAPTLPVKVRVCWDLQRRSKILQHSADVDADRVELQRQTTDHRSSGLGICQEGVSHFSHQTHRSSIL
jgi:hypothetical protein